MMNSKSFQVSLNSKICHVAIYFYNFSLHNLLILKTDCIIIYEHAHRFMYYSIFLGILFVLIVD